MKLKYVVVFEQTPNNYSAYLPDLPGCVSTGKTWEEMQEMIREAVPFHIEGMLEKVTRCLKWRWRWKRR